MDQLAAGAVDIPESLGLIGQSQRLVLVPCISLGRNFFGLQTTGHSNRTISPKGGNTENT